MNPTPDIRALPDDRLLQQCRWEAFRGSGPGGQKRNKTSSAVRIVHQPTGISAIAAESRSQSLNRRRAFHRLRQRLAIELRQPVDLATFSPPDWWKNLLDASSRLHISTDNFPRAAGLALDLLHAHKGVLSAAAAALNITTAQLATFLQSDPALWAQTAQIRRAAHLRPLTPRT